METFQDSQNKAEIFAKAANKQIVGFEALEYCNRNSYSSEREVMPAWSRYGSLAKSVTVEGGDELSLDTKRISEYVEVKWILE